MDIPKGKKLVSQFRQVAGIATGTGTQFALQDNSRWSITFSCTNSNTLFLTPGAAPTNVFGLFLASGGTTLFTFSYPVHGDIVRQPWHGRNGASAETMSLVETFLVDE